MSRVTGLTLITSLDDDGAKAILRAFEDWKIEPPRKVVDTAGSKHPQKDVYVGGYDYFDIERMAYYFRCVDFEFPENAVLVMQPEEGETEVIRPRGFK